jgi:uncharacterized repeat protein (TIGR01451 family)
VFSFGDVVVDHNRLTLYQISEPLQATSSATTANPAPFGTDINGVPLHDPIADTQVDPSTGRVVSVPATGPSALLDAMTVIRPDVGGRVTARLSAPKQIETGQDITYEVAIRNGSEFALSGTQVRFRLPPGLRFAGPSSADVTLQGDEIVFTLGHLAVSAERTVEIPVRVSPAVHRHAVLRARAGVYSSTALPLETNAVATNIR